MPTPLDNKAQLARIQTVKQELPSLEEMRATLLKFEADKNESLLVRQLFGIQRTLVDHMRMLVAVQKAQAQGIEKKFQALVAEIAALLKPQPEEAQMVTEQKPSATTDAPVWQGPKEEHQSVTVNVDVPVTKPVTSQPPIAPQMTMTPVIRQKSDKPANKKGAAK